MAYRDDLDALRARHDELAKELIRLNEERSHLEALSRRADDLEVELSSLRKRVEALQERRGRKRLEDVSIASPCSARWEDMIGDDRVRFCGECGKNVYDVSAMTRDEAEALIDDSEGGMPCLRMYRRKDGTVLTADCPVGRRRRRVRRLVAVACGGAGLAAAALIPPEALLRATSMQIRGPDVPVPTTAEDPTGNTDDGRYVLGWGG